MKKVLIINGSASGNSSNQKLIDNLIRLAQDSFHLAVFNDLKILPHFDPELSIGRAPEAISDFRRSIEGADGVIICTPEYVFSIPSGLKNAIEWCVSTTVFSDKPTGIITASASGEKGHEELQLIMKTILAKFSPATTLLIRGIKGKISTQGEIIDPKTKLKLDHFMNAFVNLVEEG